MFEDLIKKMEDAGIEPSQLHRIIASPDGSDWEYEIFDPHLTGVVLVESPTDAMCVDITGYQVLTISNALQAIVFITTVLTVIANGWIVPDILILAHTLEGLSEVEELLFHALAKVTTTTLIMGDRKGTSVLDFYRKDNGASMKEAFDNATNQPPENI